MSGDRGQPARLEYSTSKNRIEGQADGHEEAKTVVIYNNYRLLLVILFTIGLAAAMSGACQKNEQGKYGLTSNKGYFQYSYFITNSKLVVINSDELQNQFLGDEYRELEKKTSDPDIFVDIDTIHMNVIQRIMTGTKYVFVFESCNDLKDLLVINRLAFECDSLRHENVFPKDCTGYYMELGSDIPPDLNSIVQGTLTVEYIDNVRGIIIGRMSLVLADKQSISGTFSVVDKGKRLFFNIPAGHVRLVK